MLRSSTWPGKKHRLASADFMKMIEARSQWKVILNNIFHVIRENNYHSRILNPEKISSMNESEIKTFSNM